jgi:hypothetical protein
MDILNFISWVKGSRVVTSVDASKTLLPVGLKDSKRDDGYLAGAISVADLLTGAVPNFDLGTEGFKAGTNAGGTITTSIYVTAIGYGALGLAEEGQDESIAIGSYALGSVVVAGSGTNMAIGVFSMGNTTTGASNNIAIGRYTMQASQSPGSDNLAIGSNAMQLSAGGSRQNVALGHNNLQSISNGYSNTALGYSSLGILTTGIENTAVGRNTLSGTTTGSSNTVIGFRANYSGNYTGCIVIGHEAQANGNNQFVIGSVSVNAGSVTTEVNTSGRVWNVIINGVARKILLA